MKTNNIIVGIIGIMICAIMIGGAFLPAVNSVTKTYDTFDNTKDALFEMVELDDTSNYTLIWRVSDPDIVNVNGTDTAIGSGSIICSLGEFTIRYSDSSGSKRIQTFGTTSNHAITDSTVGGVFTLTVSNGTVNYTITGDEIETITGTATVTEGYAICPKGAGSFVMKAPTQGAYVLGDSKIIGMGITPIGSAWNVGFMGVGTVNDITVTQYSGGANYTVGDVTITSDTVNGYNDLHTITSYQFDVTNTSDSTVTHIIYSYFIVPAKVTADLSNPIDAPIRAMMGVLPIVAIAGLVMAGIYVFISRK